MNLVCICFSVKKIKMNRFLTVSQRAKTPNTPVKSIEKFCFVRNSPTVTGKYKKYKKFISYNVSASCDVAIAIWVKRSGTAYPVLGDVI